MIDFSIFFQISIFCLSQVRQGPEGPGTGPHRAADLHGSLHIRGARSNLLDEGDLRRGYLQPDPPPGEDRRARDDGPGDLWDLPGNRHNEHSRQCRGSCQCPRQPQPINVHVPPRGPAHGPPRDRLPAVEAPQVQRELCVHLARGLLRAPGSHRRDNSCGLLSNPWDEAEPE